MNTKITLVLDSNQNYVKLLVPCLVSILYNKKPSTELDIYIFDAGISNYDKNKIKELATFNNTNNCTISFIDCKKEFSNIDTNNEEIKKRFGAATLRRLLVPKLFKHIDRVLYLDVDTIVRGDLLDFFNQDLEGYYCAANKGKFKVQKNYLNSAINYNSKFCKVIDVLLEMGIPKEMLNSDEQYNVNGGVILYNNQKINKDNKAEELINLGIKYSSCVLYIDENTIVAVFKNKIKAMQPIYNYWIPNEEYILAVDSIKTKYSSLLKNAIIYHFGGKAKPSNFNKLFKIPEAAYKEFYKYFQMSYLRINPIKLNFIFILASIKRFRFRMFGTSVIDGKKVFRFFKFRLVLKDVAK